MNFAFSIISTKYLFI